MHLKYILSLEPHRTTPCPSVDALSVRLMHDADARAWWLRYTLSGDLVRLRIPAPASRPSTRDGLWRHTCFEAFVRDGEGPAYREFNFSPSGDWAAYRFSAERQRDDAACTLPTPRIACAHAARALVLDAWLPTAALPGPGPEWLLGLSAVIECDNGQLSYWALHHPGSRPDFHQRAGWTARVSTHAPAGSRICPSP